MRKSDELPTRSGLMQPLLAVVSAYGIDEKQLLGVPESKPLGPGISLAVNPPPLVDLLAQAIALTGDPAVALNYGRHLGIADIGPLGFALMSCADIESVLRLLIRYHPIISPDVRWQFLESLSGATVRVELTSGSPMEKVLSTESIFSSVKRIGDFLLVGGLPELELHLDYPRPSYSELYFDIFGSQVVFNSEHCQLLFPQEVLKRTLSTANPEAQVVLRQQCELIINQLDSGKSLSSKIRWILVQSCGNFPNIHEIASKLCMSERTLRRRLVSEETNYSQLVEELRNVLAKEYLRTTNFSATDIALLLGYTERVNFKRAFIRWNDMPPSEYRKNARSQ